MSSPGAPSRAEADPELAQDPRARLPEPPPSALRFLTPAVRAAACGLPRRGRVCSLALPRQALGPRPWLATSRPLQDPIAGRGVLLDLARAAGRAWLEPLPPIRAEDLDECAERQGVVTEPGDLLLIRTGWLGRVCRDGASGDYRRGPAPGLAASCTRWLEDRRISLLATDTAWVEAWPVPPGTGSTALRALALERLGLVLGSSFHLDDLAEQCAGDGDYAFLMILPPTVELGATQPVALK